MKLLQSCCNHTRARSKLFIMAAPPRSIVLDTTLRDLYCMEDPEAKEIVLINAVPTAKVQMTSSLPLSRKFAYQSPFAETEGADTLARIFLQVVPQTFGSIAGDMPLVIFDLDEDQEESEPRFPLIHRSDADESFEQIVPSQRPRVTFVKKPEDIDLRPGSRIAVSVPMDCLSHISHTVDQEVHYSLASKKHLWSSGLPTPETQIIDAEVRPDQVDDVELIEKEVSRMITPVIERPPPFVIKMPSAVAGFGTFVIRTKEDHANVVQILPAEIKILLRQINDENMHMSPCCLIVQEMIPGDSHLISLFITQSGKAVVNGYCKQIVGDSGRFGGAFISYKEQDQLRLRFAGLIESLAKFLHQNGFYGPLGIDVLTDSKGRHLIIDMNMRVTGSHPLGFLKTHFSQRNLHEAVVFFPLILNCTRAQFQQEFHNEFRDGSLVVNGWCHDGEGKVSLTSIVLASGDRESLDRFIDRINVFRMN